MCLTRGPLYDVLRETGEFVAQASANFETVVEALPNFLANEPFSNRSYQLSNGWWLYINLSTKEIKRVCGRLLQAAGIPASEWAVTEHVDTTTHLETPGESEDNYFSEQQKGEAANFNDACVEVISQHLGVSLIKQGTIQYASPDKQCRVVCAVSKAYVRSNETAYWYAFHPSQDELIMQPLFCKSRGFPFGHLLWWWCYSLKVR